MITIINFTHKLSSQQLADQFSGALPRVIDIPVQIIDFASRPFADQIRDIVDVSGFTADQWQSEDFIVNVAGMSPATAGILAEIHGRSGHFPKMLLMERGTERYHIAGIQDLQAIREAARNRRF